ncbi:type 1 glutamine amidotransferase [Photobacterium sagamiensis]|uniref:type 1 glutamine amidotransferase n=1 Tax=Photobacterium sagamiensis TaxID=2910241 RepID=UPI003D114042
MKILVVQNDKLAPAGHFGQSLISSGAELETLHSYQGDRLSECSSVDYHGLVVLGGKIGAFDDQQNPFLNYVISLIHEFHLAQKPVFGICLGAQLLARALDTGFRSNHGWELSFTDINVTVAGEQDPVFSGLPQECRLYEMHQDSFYLPKNSQLLMTSENCSNQAFRAGRWSYGVQFHPEVTEQIVRDWAGSVREALGEKGHDMAQQMLEFTTAEFSTQHIICQQLAERWLALIKY